MLSLDNQTTPPKMAVIWRIREEWPKFGRSPTILRAVYKTNYCCENWQLLCKTQEQRRRKKDGARSKEFSAIKERVIKNVCKQTVLSSVCNQK
jgi:hypothetical protein